MMILWQESEGVIWATRLVNRDLFRGPLQWCIFFSLEQDSSGHLDVYARYKIPIFWKIHSAVSDFSKENETSVLC